MRKKITLLFLVMLTTSIDLFANAEIVIYNNSTGTTVGSDFTISSNNFKNIVEAGDNIVVTVKDYTRVGENYPYFQIEWGNWVGWNNLGTDLSNGENVVPLTAEDVTKINSASTYGINFRTNGTTSYTITKVVLRKNDSYADLETVTLNEDSYSDGFQFQKVYGSSEAALRMSDGDLLVVVGKSDANSGGSWSMRELSTWDNTYSTGSFDGRDYAYIVASDKGSRIHNDGFQFVTNKEMSAVKIAKKIYSLSQSATPDFSSIVQSSPINVKFTHTFKSGWNTICLPFATTATDIATEAEVYTYISSTNEAITLTKVDDGTMSAGTPYMLYITGAAPSSPITFTNVNVSATTAGDGITANGLTFKGNFTAGMSMSGNYGLVNDGSTSSIKHGGTNATLPAFAAYFDGTKPATSRGFSIVVGDGTTNIDTFYATEDEEDGPIYNLMGQKTNTVGKGIYIKNGKKYIAK